MMFTITTEQELKDFNDAVKAGEVTDIKRLSEFEVMFRMDGDIHKLLVDPKYTDMLKISKPILVAKNYIEVGGISWGIF